jgi:N6-L-threonylcarbamoyladenine synthase
MTEGSGGHLRSGLILGIESSCDETAAAVVRAGEQVLSNVVASQVELHALYGGVVPELASREHLRNIVPVVRAAMARGGVSFGDLDAIAVTEGPGILYAKALAFGLQLPLIGINHLEGHIHAVVMESRRTGILESAGFPLLALVVSGGHSHLYLAEGAHDRWSYRNVGRTVDDAAGEAFDKVAKLLGLGYPGGPWIDRLAPLGDPAAVPFQFNQIKSKVRVRDPEQIPGTPNGAGVRFDFSFSGIKTAVLRYVQANAMTAAAERRMAALKAHPASRVAEVAALCDRQTLDLIASFQAAVVGNLLRQTFAAAEAFGARGLLISGGVAANSELRRRASAEAARRGLPIGFPSAGLSTDNAAMIAAAAWPRLQAGETAPDGMTAAPQMPLG